MITYPADERRIQEVERGRSCGAVLRLPPGGTLAAGDSIVFALAHSRPGREPCYVKGGDSVRVLLTVVTVLGEPDPDTGRALAQLAWEPLGQDEPLGLTDGRAVKSRRARGRA